MIFLFPKKKIILDCFIDRPEVFEFAKIAKASEYLPSWWKNLPKPKISFKDLIDNGTANMRHCAGFVELFRNSFVIPMWSDLLLEIGKEGTTDYRWQYADNKSSLKIHPAKQRGAYLDEYKYQHFKLNSPWQLKTKKDIKFVWSGAIWNMERPEELIWLPAVDNYYYQTATTINFMCRRSEENKEILIPFKQPLIYLTPATDKKISIKLHLVSSQDLYNINNKTFFPSSFTNSYGKLKKEKDDTKL